MTSPTSTEIARTLREKYKRYLPNETCDCVDVQISFEVDVKQAIDSAIESEREACAKVAEGFAPYTKDEGCYERDVFEVSTAIRARSLKSSSEGSLRDSKSKGQKS